MAKHRVTQSQYIISFIDSKLWFVGWIILGPTPNSIMWFCVHNSVYDSIVKSWCPNYVRRIKVWLATKVPWGLSSDGPGCSHLYCICQNAGGKEEKGCPIYMQYKLNR